MAHGPAMRVNRSRPSRVRLWAQLVELEVRKSYVGSALGIAWAFLQPLLFLSTYFVLFHVILEVEREGRSSLEVLVLILSGLVPWLYFASTLGRGTAILNSHAPLIKQINFPINLLPFVTVAEATVEAAVGFFLLSLLSWYAGLIGWMNLLILPAISLLALFLVGLSAIVGCYSVMLPDIRKLIPTLLRVLIFLTPVLYLPSRMPESLKLLAYINPMTYFISLIRYAIMQEPDVGLFGFLPDFLGCLAWTGAALGCGYLHRGYVRSRVVDYL